MNCLKSKCFWSWRHNNVTICCHDNKSLTYIHFYYTINLWNFYWHTSNSFGDIGRGQIPSRPWECNMLHFLVVYFCETPQRLRPLGNYSSALSSIILFYSAHERCAVSIWGLFIRVGAARLARITYLGGININLVSYGKKFISLTSLG